MQSYSFQHSHRSTSSWWIFWRLLSFAKTSTLHSSNMMRLIRRISLYLELSRNLRRRWKEAKFSLTPSVFLAQTRKHSQSKLLKWRVWLTNQARWNMGERCPAETLWLKCCRNIWRSCCWWVRRLRRNSILWLRLELLIKKARKTLLYLCSL